MPKLKIKMLSRNPDNYTRECKHDLQKVSRNYNPEVHPFEKQREYVRALNATKLERVFAKPFMGTLDGHRDGVTSLCNHPTKLSTIASGCYDGEIKLWHIPSKKCLSTVTGHTGQVRGICFSNSGEHFFTCGDDKVIRMWEMDETNGGFNTTPKNSIATKDFLYGIDHHAKENKYATCGGDSAHIWDAEKSEPIREFRWGVDSVTKIKFNPIEDNLVAACGSDRSIMFYDIRGSQPVRKVTLKMKSNSLSWNPMEAFSLVVANEDYKSYLFDIRGLAKPSKMYRGHVSAVLDIDYAPTGKEFVTVSHDRTIRIHTQATSYSRDVYHLKRMQITSSVKWSRDNQFIMTGSDESVIRVWKANASEKLGVKSQRFTNAEDYNAKLKAKFSDFPQIKRIASHRHIPRAIYVEQGVQTQMENKKKRMEAYHLRTKKIKPKDSPFGNAVVAEDE